MGSRATAKCLGPPDGHNIMDFRRSRPDLVRRSQPAMAFPAFGAPRKQIFAKLANGPTIQANWDLQYVFGKRVLRWQATDVSTHHKDISGDFKIIFAAVLLARRS